MARSGDDFGYGLAALRSPQRTKPVAAIGLIDAGGIGRVDFVSAGKSQLFGDDFEGDGDLSGRE